MAAKTFVINSMLRVCVVLFALTAGVARAQTFWVYTDLHDFGGTVTNANGTAGPDGEGPCAGVTFDSAGNMYGTASADGPNGTGTLDSQDFEYGDGMIWEMTTSGTYRDLHDFGGTVTNANGSIGPDGISPCSAVTFDSAGNMYGTTLEGGANGCDPAEGEFGGGMVWEITASGIYRDLHDFGGWVTNANGESGRDGGVPQAGVTFDSAGNMYGTTESGGANGGDGILWEITASGTYRDLHDFGGWVTNANGESGRDGGVPRAGVTFDSAGNMYERQKAAARTAATAFSGRSLRPEPTGTCTTSAEL